MMNYDAFLSRASGHLKQSAIRQMGMVLAGAKDIVSFAPGYPAEDAFPWEAFRAIAQELLAGADGSVLQYGPTPGYRPLREDIVEIMRGRAIEAQSDRMLITTGSQQGLDLLGRVLIDPGDVILMELPSYTGAISAFRAAGADLIGVRQDADGVNLDHLDATIVRLRGEGRTIKALYLVPNFQNPTGLMIGLEKRRSLLEWAARRDVLLIEDDPYRDIYFTDVTREEETRPLAADDAEGRVLYLSSFSKTLAPGLRLGWVHGPAPIVSKMELAKQAGALTLVDTHDSQGGEAA